jgi:hypothetical protein
MTMVDSGENCLFYDTRFVDSPLVFEITMLGAKGMDDLESGKRKWNDERRDRKNLYHS